MGGGIIKQERERLIVFFKKKKGYGNGLPNVT